MEYSDILVRVAFGQGGYEPGLCAKSGLNEETSCKMIDNIVEFLQIFNT